MAASLNRHWNEAIHKEERLRLNWFTKNEATLLESTKKTEESHVGEDDLQELVDTRKHLYSAAFRHPRIKGSDPEPEAPDESFDFRMMKPVLQEHTDMLYNRASNENRVAYLKERMKILPENRYYFPETTSFRHGWKMWDCAKTMEASKFGKSAIVRASFYRRRAGIERDPDWYTYPAKLSPTVCTCT